MLEKQIEFAICKNKFGVELEIEAKDNILYCSNKELISIDLSNCPNIDELYCVWNELMTIDLSSCPNLKRVYCYRNKLISVDISKNDKLKHFVCYENNFYGKDCFINPKSYQTDVVIKENGLYSYVYFCKKTKQEFFDFCQEKGYREVIDFFNLK
jgi:hypothetical protein